jgi:hypothetical protein
MKNVGLVVHGLCLFEHIEQIVDIHRLVIRRGRFRSCSFVRLVHGDERDRDRFRSNRLMNSLFFLNYKHQLNL